MSKINEDRVKHMLRRLTYSDLQFIKAMVRDGVLTQEELILTVERMKHPHREALNRYQNNLDRVMDCLNAQTT